MTGYTHIAISAGDINEANSITARIRNDGYRVISEPRTTDDGYYESCIHDNEGNFIEIAV